MKVLFVTSNESKLREEREILVVEIDSVDLELPESQAFEVSV